MRPIRPHRYPKSGEVDGKSLGKSSHSDFLHVVSTVQALTPGQPSTFVDRTVTSGGRTEANPRIGIYQLLASTTEMPLLQFARRVPTSPKCLPSRSFLLPSWQAAPLPSRLLSGGNVVGMNGRDRQSAWLGAAATLRMLGTPSVRRARDALVVAVARRPRQA